VPAAARILNEPARAGIAGLPEQEARFQKLLPAADWQQLPAAIQRRFSHHLADGEQQVFLGEVAATRLSIFGWLYAQLARLVGGPLPLSSGTRGTAAVIVTADRRLGGQIWTRMYGHAGNFPQVIHSAKRFYGPTGLEEYVGRGIGMTLSLHVVERALVFRSERYFVRMLGRTFYLPEFLCPGRLEVIHREERAGRFSFTLQIRHRWFGEIVQQIAFFTD
jgi:hypothetical protein